MKRVGFVAAVLGLIFAGALRAAEPVTPTTAPGVEVITIDQAKGLVGKAQFFDMRSAVNFGKGHIKGAVALPYDNKSDNAPNFDATKDKFNVAKLPSDKSTTIVFYSDGPSGWKSYKAAIQAAKMGYKNVKWMREGTTGWMAKSLPLE